MSNISRGDHKQHPEPVVGTVLLISEKAFLIRRMASVLKDAGYQVTDAPDCRRALEQLGVIVPDLVIIEGNTLPDGTSEDLQRIRESFLSLLVLIGSEPGHKAWPQAVALGADLYLERPVDERELLARINALLRRAIENRR